jgi:hypothetical protein
MSQDNVVKLAQPGTLSDPLTEILRNGARCWRTLWRPRLQGFSATTPTS